jgi:hypothetical protein
LDEMDTLKRSWCRQRRRCSRAADAPDHREARCQRKCCRCYNEVRGKNQSTMMWQQLGKRTVHCMVMAPVP